MQLLKKCISTTLPTAHVKEGVINTDTSVCLYTEDTVGVITSTVSISWLNGEIVPEVWMEEVALINKNNHVTLQVGNAFPPLLGRKLGQIILTLDNF